MANVSRKFFLGAICLLLSSCVLAPLFDSVHKAGMTESDRMALLPTAVKRFHEGLMWGDPALSLSFVESEGFDKIKTELRNSARKEKVVESSVIGVDFRESAFYADVEVGVKRYEVPYYIVRERREKQVWHFNLTDGWKLQTREALKDDA